MTQAAPDFDEVWRRILEHEAKGFQTRLGRLFTYRVEGDCVLPSHSDFRIPKGDFALAYPFSFVSQ